VVDMLVNSIKKTDIDLRRTLYSEIVMAGGCTLLQDFPARFLNEIKMKAPADVKVK